MSLPDNPIEKAAAERLDRLPQWAQRRIAQLEDTATYYQEKLRQAEEGDTDTWVANHDGDIGLPRGSHVRFGPRWTGIDVTAFDEGAIYVRAETGRILVEPQSGNTIKVWASDHRSKPNAAG